MSKGFLDFCGNRSLFVDPRRKPSGWPPSPQHPTIALWPVAAPGVTANPLAEGDTTTAKDNLIAGRPLIRLGNVSTPTLTLYQPKNGGTGAAVVVFPGGGYRILAIDLEGTEVCDWLNSAGITCVLLKYRVPDTGPYPKSAAALQDAQRAFGLVRSHAAEWHIDPNRIGVLGFSAGAHLAAALSTHYDLRLYDPIDAVDKLSCRPDFASSSTPVTWPWPTRTSLPTPTSNPMPKPHLPSSCRRKMIRHTSKMRWSTSWPSRTPRCPPSCISMRKAATDTACGKMDSRSIPGPVLWKLG